MDVVILIMSEEKKNFVKCLKCNKEIFSSRLHDYTVCDCGNVSVKGGGDHICAYSKDFYSFSYLPDAPNIESNNDCERKYDDAKERLGKKELLEAIEKRIECIDHLNKPHTPVTYAEIRHLYLLLAAFLRSL